MKIVANLESNQDHFEILKKLFNDFMNIKLVNFNSLEEVKIFSIHTPINLLIITNPNPIQSPFSISQNKSNIQKVLLITHDKLIDDDIKTLPIDSTWDDILKTSHELLGEEQRDKVKSGEEDFQPLIIEGLCGLNLSPCDIYLLSEMEKKFIKSFSFGDEISDEGLKEIISRNDFFYIQSSDLHRFLNFATQQLIYKKNEYNSLTEAATNNSISLNYVKKAIQFQAYETEWILLVEKISVSFRKMTIAGISRAELNAVLNTKGISLDYSQWFLASLIVKHLLLELKIDTKNFNIIATSLIYAKLYLEGKQEILTTDNSEFESQDLKATFYKKFESAFNLLKGHKVGNQTMILLKEYYHLSLTSHSSENVSRLGQIMLISDTFSKTILKTRKFKNEIVKDLELKFHGESYREVLFKLKEKFYLNEI